ncbi:MAG: Rha family transcriptional regulator [Eubacteriales bacterium]|nr:Rha family transcriptional regulator [Eubacteriales bacterium]
MNDIEQSITTVEIAQMMETSHKTILQKLEGTNRNGKHTEGIIEILNGLNLQPVEFFQESTYKDAKGELRKCYNCTRKGCEFLAHKFQGKKGIQFTAEYINRFHSMESAIQEHRAAPLTEKTQNVIPIERKLKPATWYSRNKTKIFEICNIADVTPKQVYRKIFLFCGEKFDLSEAEDIYIKDVGTAPAYTMDLIEHFEQLQERATFWVNVTYRHLKEHAEGYQDIYNYLHTVE